MQNLIETISIAKCKSILEKDGSVYSEEDIKEIRKFLFKLAEMDYEVYLKLKKRENEFEKEKENQKNESENNSELKQAA